MKSILYQLLPTWEKIKYDIEIGIIKDKYQTGDKLPSINQLAFYYKVSTATSQKVLENLIQDGVAIKKKGIGYFVKPYQRQRLIEKHTDNLRQYLIDCAEIAQSIDIGNEELINILHNILSSR